MKAANLVGDLARKLQQSVGQVVHQFVVPAQDAEGDLEVLRGLGPQRVGSFRCGLVHAVELDAVLFHECLAQGPERFAVDLVRRAV